MAISEEDRHELYLALERALGRKQATTMMEHLPPVGWADVATKHDLAALEHAVEAALHREIAGMQREIGGVQGEVQRQITELHREIAGVHREIGAAVRTMVLTSLTAVVAVGGLAFAAAGLT